MFNKFGTEPRIPETLRIGFMHSYKELITTHFWVQELIYFGFHREHFWLQFVDRVQCVIGEGWKRSTGTDRVKNEVLQRVKDEGTI